MSTTRVTIRQWMSQALQLQSSNGLSTEFIIAAALRIAISLTEQLVNNNADSSEDDTLPPPFPISRIDWTDSIEVSYSENDDLGGSPVTLSANAPAPAPSDLPNGATGVSQGGGKAGTDGEGARSVPSLLNVLGAKLVHNNFCNGSYKTNIPNGELQRIYSLGLVLYQLFSLGRIPLTPDLMAISSSDGELTLFSSSLNSSSVNGKGSYTNGTTGPFDDFSRVLNVSDDHFSNGNNSERLDRESESESSAKRQSSARMSSSGLVRCEEPINLLRIQGVPSSICDLIYNMIDCINGSLMGNDSYSKMSDVTMDLQLMLQKPSVYLNPLNTEQLLQEGLGLDETIPFGRDEEFASLQSAYQQSISGSSELAVITGLSGTGKTMMANRFGDFVTASGGLFISGKFDQMRENSFLVVASAFNKYCEELAREENSVQAVLVGFRLRATLGDDVYYLIRMIPNLRCVLNDDDLNESFSNHDCIDGQRRIHYLLTRFVDVICEASEMPMVLFLDDVQWADSASLLLINQLLQSSRSRNGKFFFLGSFRCDDVGIDHPFRNTITTATSHGFTATTVELVYLTKKVVNQFVSDLLQLSPRLVASLSDIIYQKTKGNPLFISRMLLSLNRKGLLYLSLTRHRWEWDEEKIQSEKIPDDVALFFVATINTLDANIKLALSTLACFGNSVECEVMSAIETDLGLNLTTPLDDAMREGLLYMMKGRYCFGHDRIQEAAYSMIDKSDVVVRHVNYGMSLLKSENLLFLFTAVTQLNNGGPKAVQDEEHYSMIARYNLIAGKKAVEMSEFNIAFYYFDHGISFLRKKHWQTDYELSLELYNHAAKCALVIKDMTSLTILCDGVAKNARDPDDMLDTSFITMCGLAHTNALLSIEQGLWLLDHLGIDITEPSSREETMKQIAHTGTILGAISDEMLLNSPILTVYKKEMAMKILAKMCSNLIQCKPSLLPLVLITLVRLTIDHGVSPMSAIGFAYYGGMIADRGDLRGGHRFTKLSKALVNKHQFKEIAGEVMWITSDTLTYLEPMQGIQEYRREGRRIALVGGDIQSACFNTTLMMADQLWSGDPLTRVKETVSSTQQFVSGYDHLVSLAYLKFIEDTVSRLMIDEKEHVNVSISSNTNPYHLKVRYFNQAFISLIFDNIEEMKCNAEKFFEITLPSWYLQAGYAVHTFFLGLASYNIYRETRDELWAQRGKMLRERIQSWNEQGSKWNFKHKLELMEAEEAYSNDDFDRAQILYDKAVSSAKQHKFIHEEALANELAAKFYLAKGERSISFMYFIEAHEKYYEWNAFAKVKALYASIQEMFGGSSLVLGSLPSVHGTLDLLHPRETQG